jgi:uncharacterized repeat protein (TIGR02543 family)
VEVTPQEGGTVKINGALQSSYPAYRTFVEDTVIELEAQPLAGYEFVGWSGDLSGGENPISLEMDSAKVVTAIFTNIIHPLIIQVTGHGSTNPAAGTYSYGEGSEVTVTAIPDSGWQFDGWSGEVSDPDSATTTVVITSDKTVTANFSQIMHSLTLTAEGNGHLTPEIGTHSYAERTEVTVTATPDSGWRFDGWSGEVSDPDLATTTVVITSDKTVTANFSKNIFNAGIIGIIAGSVGAGLAALFVTRRRKTRPKTTKQS